MPIRPAVPSASAAAGFALAAGLAFALVAGPAAATETLASADFEIDSAGDLARPDGPPTVQEYVYDESSGSGGSSQVVSWGGGKRYRLSDAGVSGLVRGIRAPFSAEALSGTLVVQATLVAEQTDGGATLLVEGPEKEEWLGMIGLGSDGKWVVHGSATTTPYLEDCRYGIAITVHFGENPTVDYLVTDLSDSSTLIDSTGNAAEQGLGADRIVFATGASEEGAFAIDDILATL